MSNNVTSFMSIDDMIKTGKTFPEIQAELKRLCAIRDENALKEAREKAKVSAARDTAINALQSYFSAIGIPMDSDADRKELQDIFATIESSITPAYKKLFELNISPSSRDSSKETKATVKLEDDFVDWIREFIKDI